MPNIERRLQELIKESAPWYLKPKLRNLYLLLIPAGLLPAMALGYDASMMNGLQAVAEWDKYFGSPRGAKLGIINAILPLGCIIAAPFVAPIADRFGRRICLWVGVTFIIFGGLLQGFAINLAMFTASRFIIGLGITFLNASAPILVAELAHPKERQVITSLYQTCYYLGAIVAAWTTFGTFAMTSSWSWRIPSVLQSATPIVVGIAVCFIPESPRWLAANGRVEEAHAFLQMYHGDGGEAELADLEYQQMKEMIILDKAVEMKWSNLLATPGNRKRILIIIMLGVFSQWSGNGLVSYYLARVLETAGLTSKREQNILNGCLMIFNWVTAVASAFATAYIKRRTQFLTSVIGMLSVFAIQTLCTGLYRDHHNLVAAKIVIPCLFFFYLFYNLAFNALLYSYPVEILPYQIRAKGMSILVFVGKSAVFINLLVNPIGLQAMGWHYYLVYVVWLVIEVVLVYFFFVETSGPSLEALALIFDKPKQADAESISAKETDNVVGLTEHAEKS